MAKWLKREDIAYHEAGHAVIARKLGIEVTHAALFATGDDELAGTRTRSAEYLALSAYRDGKADMPAVVTALEGDVKVSLAGPTAQRRHRPPKTEIGWDDDLERATSCAAKTVLLLSGTEPPEVDRVAVTLEPDRKSVV